MGAGGKVTGKRVKNSKISEERWKPCFDGMARTVSGNDKKKCIIKYGGKRENKYCE